MFLNGPMDISSFGHSHIWEQTLIEGTFPFIYWQFLLSFSINVVIKFSILIVCRKNDTNDMLTDKYQTKNCYISIKDSIDRYLVISINWLKFTDIEKFFNWYNKILIVIIKKRF